MVKNAVLEMSTQPLDCGTHLDAKRRGWGPKKVPAWPKADLRE